MGHKESKNSLIKNGFTKIPNSVLLNEGKLTMSEVYTLSALLAHKMNKSVCFPSLAVLIKETGMSESTLKRSIKSLEQKGYIKRQGRRTNKNGNPTSNIYGFC